MIRVELYEPSADGVHLIPGEGFDGGVAALGCVLPALAWDQSSVLGSDDGHVSVSQKA